MVYGGGNDDDDDDVRDDEVGCDVWAKRTNPVLNSVSNLYSELDVTSSVRVSSTLLVCLTLSTDYLSYCPTNYCPNKCLANIPKQEIFKLNTSLLDNVTFLYG